MARDLIERTFTLQDAGWRGVGKLAQSRLVLLDRYARFDAEKKFGIRMPEVKGKVPDSCMCGEVLQGMKPQLCPNFGQSCTPESPAGPCMVTGEGACSIAHMNRG